MQIEPHHSDPKPTPAERTGGQVVIELWLRRLCSRESIFQLASGTLVLVIGLGILAFMFVVLVGGFFRFFLLGINPVGVIGLALAYFILTFRYAHRTRWGTDAAARISFGSPASSMWYLICEILSAGPIFIVLAAQDFQKFARLSRMDIQPVSALLLWLFDEGGRASFAEISLAFPGLNVVRVLPQLRDIPGIYWSPDEGRISLSAGFAKRLAALLRREPRRKRPFERTASRPPPFAEPPPVTTVSDETLAWYAALNLPPFATLQQVKARYRKLAKIYHPDARARNDASDDAAGDEQMKRINEAYHNILEHSQSQAGSVN
jgi:hypothetical protein